MLLRLGVEACLSTKYSKRLASFLVGLALFIVVADYQIDNKIGVKDFRFYEHARASEKLWAFQDVSDVCVSGKSGAIAGMRNEVWLMDAPWKWLIIFSYVSLLSRAVMG